MDGLATFLLEARGMTHLLIEQFMTRGPHTICHDQTLATAHRLMREHAIRHLPVLDAGSLVGLVSQRDLEFIETLKDVDPEKVVVNEAMTPQAYTVSPKSEVRAVAAEMAKNKYGSAIVTDHGHVVGVFTAVDAMRVLAQVLNEKQPAS